MTSKPANGLNIQDHRQLASWAADCAERVLPYFENLYPDDDRPCKAIEAARAWARGDLRMTDARQAAFASHAAARDADNAAARLAARAAGHAAATAHVASHAPHAAAYAVKAVAAIEDTGRALAENDWQLQHLPKHLRSFALPDWN